MGFIDRLKKLVSSTTQRVKAFISRIIPRRETRVSPKLDVKQDKTGLDLKVPKPKPMLINELFFKPIPPDEERKVVLERGIEQAFTDEHKDAQIRVLLERIRALEEEVKILRQKARKVDEAEEQAQKLMAVIYRRKEEREDEDLDIRLGDTP